MAGKISKTNVTGRQKLQHRKICPQCTKQMKPVKVIPGGMFWGCIECEYKVSIGQGVTLKDEYIKMK